MEIDGNKLMLDIEAELYKCLQEELQKCWEQTPIGYNKENRAYHLGKGMFVNKEVYLIFGKMTKEKCKKNKKINQL